MSPTFTRHLPSVAVLLMLFRCRRAEPDPPDITDPPRRPSPDEAYYYRPHSGLGYRTPREVRET